MLGKGVDGCLETMGGTVLLFVSRQDIRDVVHAVFRHELFEDPNDLVANYLVQLAAGLSVSTKTFAAVYLLVHGLVKLGLVTAIWRNRLWAYPLAGIILFLFAVYQLVRFTFTHSLILLLLTAVDIFIIALLPSEYKRLSASGADETASGARRTRSGQKLL
jgi:uncharacterized membrane protein